MDTYAMKKAFEDVANHVEEAKDAFDAIDYDDEVDLTDDVALPALLALSDLMSLLRDLREAGADLAEVPAEEEALVLVIANGHKVAAAIKADVEHLEKVMARFGPGPG